MVSTPLALPVSAGAGRRFGFGFGGGHLDGRDGLRLFGDLGCRRRLRRSRAVEVDRMHPVEGNRIANVVGGAIAREGHRELAQVLDGLQLARRRAGRVDLAKL
jgi:hypothetical protein